MARRRYICERCGGSGQQESGLWDGKSYASQEGTCTACNGEGLLGFIPEENLSEADKRKIEDAE